MSRSRPAWMLLLLPLLAWPCGCSDSEDSERPVPAAADAGDGSSNDGPVSSDSPAEEDSGAPDAADATGDGSFQPDVSDDTGHVDADDSGTGGDTEFPDTTVDPPDSAVPPIYNAAARVFVPEIVPRDSSQTIGDTKQQSAIFWFGEVDSRNNCTDVRVGYDETFLMIHAAVFDRQIYDDASDDVLEEWDSISLLVDPDGTTEKTQIDSHSLRIDAQAHRQGTERTVVYRGDGGTWTKTGETVGMSPGEGSPISIVKGYRGEERDESRGWSLTFYLRWSAIGLSGPPSTTDAPVWRVALTSHDRDSSDGSLRGSPQHWPDRFDGEDPSGWGAWEFLDGHFLGWEESGSSDGQGRPAYSIAYAPPEVQPGSESTVTIREGLDGDTIENTCVGASETLCSGNDDYNFGDGDASFGGHTAWNFFHVQNQEDYADWPCFARIYLKFPLTKLPASAKVISARLLLHHKEPTSGGDQGARSLIQAFSVANTLRGTDIPWDATNTSWNSAPLAVENLAGMWGDRTGNMDVGWNELPMWEWDVSRAVAQMVGESHLSFALYSADTDYHTGKQFVTSADFPDWGDPGQRPSLEITYGQ